MKVIRFVSAGAALLLAAVAAHAQGYAPTSLIGNTLFNGTLTGSSGGANGDGTFSDLFSVNGMDYTVSTSNTLSSPAPYVYASTGANTGTITEGSLVVTLTFTSVSGGTFAAVNGSATQVGTFSLVSLGVPTALNALVMGNSLVNFSNLQDLQAGSTTTAGFEISGTIPQEVLIRASGPGLQQFGLTGTLATPEITLYNSSGSVLATDSGWGGSAALQTAFAETGAFAFASGSADSAILTSLPPGNYTAQVKSTSGTDTGYVLIEVYVVH